MDILIGFIMMGIIILYLTMGLWLLSSFIPENEGRLTLFAWFCFVFLFPLHATLLGIFLVIDYIITKVPTSFLRKLFIKDN